MATTWAERTEAVLRDSELRSRPHLVLACGHLSPRGRGPLAQAGYGYCPEHGVQRIESEGQADDNRNTGAHGS